MSLSAPAAQSKPEVVVVCGDTVVVPMGKSYRRRAVVGAAVDGEQWGRELLLQPGLTVGEKLSLCCISLSLLQVFQ